MKTIILQAADEILGKYDAFTQNKNLKRRDHEIKLIVRQKNVAFHK
jgi:hypothetical protein